MGWSAVFRKGIKRFGKSAELDNVVSEIKLNKSGIKSIDDVFENLPTSNIDNEISVNGTKLRSVEPDLRIGNIRKALDDMKISSTVTSSDESALKNILKKEVPDFQVNDLTTKIDSAKAVHSDLNVKSATDGNALKESLTPSAQAKVTSAWSKIKTAAGTAGIAAGIIAAIVIGEDLWESINTATKERNGCFVTKIVNGKTTGCKLLNRSCEYQQGTPCDTSIASTINFNINLLLKHAIANDSTLLSKINTDTGLSITSDNVDTVLNSSDNVTKLVEWYDTNKSNTTLAADLCALIGQTTLCLACDPTATANSVNYVDASDLAENCSLKCIADSSLLETLVDVTTGMGLDVFEDVKSAISGDFDIKKYGIIIVAIIAIIIVVFLVIRFLPKKKTEGVVYQPIPPTYNTGATYSNVAY